MGRFPIWWGDYRKPVRKEGVAHFLEGQESVIHSYMLLCVQGHMWFACKGQDCLERAIYYLSPRWLRG